MSPFLLSVLKYGLLLLLYLFVWRALRSVARDLRVAQPAPQRAVAPGAARATRKAKPPAVVVVRNADGKRRGTFKLVSPMDVGRAETCRIQPEDTYISQMHARFLSRDGDWYVEDLGSTNGTFVNEERIQAATPVKAGDKVRVGTTLLELHR
ncbi:MAG TPA: FHA domain-containing protein [Actinomycetota bacterium]|nr:FHA domain-containing protein [Actinomycetota bacterium]